VLSHRAVLQAGEDADEREQEQPERLRQLDLTILDD
jgi:hypothetical protein